MCEWRTKSTLLNLPKSATTGVLGGNHSPKERKLANMTPDFQEFLNHLTNNALQSLKHADAIARSFGSAYVGTEHLLLGVLAQEGSMGAKFLEEAGVTLDRARLALNLTPKTLVVNVGAKGLSETAKLTLKMAYDVAQDYGQEQCGTE